jgi:ADP-heptose:LPS heptosyltransferase
MRFSPKLAARFTKNKIRRSISRDIRQYYEDRNKILIFRQSGGLGDILVHRMIFEDFKRIMPDMKLIFACPKNYHDAVYDHPYIDELIDADTCNTSHYHFTYNTSSACCRYEVRMSPQSDKSRSDIWANHCGVELQNHEMHINLEDEYINEAREEIEKHRNHDGPSVLIAPITAMKNKNLLPFQIKGLVEGLRERGLFVFSTHTTSIPELAKYNVPVLQGGIRKWMGYIYNADYVVSTDTSVFHCAGGLKKPLVGIYTFADGKVYGRYYDFFLVQKHREDDPCWTCGPCYNWPDCTKTKTPYPKPCLTEITPQMILEKVDMMLNKWPIVKN